MKHKKITTAVLAVLIGALLFIVGMRCGLHDADILAAEKQNRAAETAVQPYIERVAALEQELAEERQIEHVVYEYHPLPVDYENIGPAMPEEDDIVLMSKMLYMEAGISNTFSQISAAADVPLWRVDAGYGTLRRVITAPDQFMGYNPHHPVDSRIYMIAKDTLLRHALAKWERETFGFTLVSTVVPSDYLWFTGDGVRNHFTNNAGGRITP